MFGPATLLVFLVFDKKPHGTWNTPIQLEGRKKEILYTVRIVLLLCICSPSVCDLALFTLFMSLVSNVVNTNDIIQVIFPR